MAASRAELVIAALWLVAWALALGWAVHLSALDPGTSTASRWLTVGVGLGLATVTGVVGTSTWLAARARWVQQLVFAVFVVVLSTAWYVAAMLLLSPPGPEGDTGDVAAGAGLVVLLLPTVLLVALLAGVGSGLGLVIARLRH